MLPAYSIFLLTLVIPSIRTLISLLLFYLWEINHIIMNTNSYYYYGIKRINSEYVITNHKIEDGKSLSLCN